VPTEAKSGDHEMVGFSLHTPASCKSQLKKLIGSLTPHVTCNMPPSLFTDHLKTKTSSLPISHPLSSRYNNASLIERNNNRHRTSRGNRRWLGSRTLEIPSGKALSHHLPHPPSCTRNLERNNRETRPGGT